jgi:BirA family biotin operon repressor/biotin-[acetyl-CoA-carboxylase] ligase
MKHLRFESIDSTNTYLKTHSSEYPTFQVVSAVHQTKGRGRMGNVWIDDGTQALFSILIKDEALRHHIELLPFVTAKILHETFLDIIPSLQIKWPNDILAHAKKLAGILVETIVEDGKVVAAVIGIGINVNTKTFPEELKDIATSIRLETGKETDSLHWIELIATRLETTWNASLFDEVIPYCDRHSFLKGRPVTTFQNGHLLHGTAGSIQADGTLEVSTDHGLFHVRSGEVNWIKNKDAKR